MDELNVLTLTSELGNLELLANQVVEGFIIGMHKSPFHGFSAEFAEHRLYNSGESTRHIDWKVMARSEKVFVKRYEEETNLRCHVLLDNSGSMHYPEMKTTADSHWNKITFSVVAASVLFNVLKRQRDAFGLTIFDDKIEIQTEAKSTTIHQKLLTTYLQKVLNEPFKKSESNVAESIHLIADKIHKRSLVILFTDMFETSLNDDGNMEAIWSSLQHLKHNKHEVIIFHVTDKATEIDFEFENRPYKFIDLETGEELKLQPSEVKEKYKAHMHKFYAELKLKCSQFRIDLVEADVRKGFNQILLPYFVKRTKMM